ncbi:MAG TPA: SRPBCC family protein [Devosia sp.]|nr:SRPBCC family protein [Devosia sp.]
MSSKINVAPITKSVRVRTTPERAFAIFTTNVLKWWPPTYTIGNSPMKEVVMEPHVGGRWFEIGEDDSQCQWGDVLVWNPPQRLVLAWRIGMDWQFNAALLTEVEVTFTAVGDGETEVRIVHRKFENYGAEAEKAAQIFDGWSANLARFAAVVHGETPQ